MNEVATEFSLEKLIAMAKGAWHEFNSPMKE
jgi:hypothetical protein